VAGLPSLVLRWPAGAGSAGLVAGRPAADRKYNDAAKTISESCRIEHIEYHQDGIVEHQVRDEQADEMRITKYRDVKLDINWQSEPAFGDWTAIARYDREPSAEAPHEG